MSRSKSVEKRKLILKKATHLFLRHGFSDVSMDMIRDETGVSKNTLYNHFENKSALFRAVIFEQWQNDSTPDINGIEGETLAATLEKFGVALLNYLYKRRSQDFFRILIAESGRFPNLAQSIIVDNQSPIFRHVSAYLAQSLKLDDEKARRAAAYLFGLLKEDAFWHVLAGFRRPYTKAEIILHVKQAVAAFMKIAETL